MTFSRPLFQTKPKFPAQPDEERFLYSVTYEVIHHQNTLKDRSLMSGTKKINRENKQ